MQTSRTPRGRQPPQPSSTKDPGQSRRPEGEKAHPRNGSLPPESKPRRRGLSTRSPPKRRRTRCSSTRAGRCGETSHSPHLGSTPASNTRSNAQSRPASAQLCRRKGMPLWARTAQGLQARAHLRGLNQAAQPTPPSGSTWPRAREPRPCQFPSKRHSSPQAGGARSTSASCHSRRRYVHSAASRDPIPPAPLALSCPSQHLCRSGPACRLPLREERRHGRAAPRAREPRPLENMPALASCVVVPCHIRLSRPPRWCCTWHHWGGRVKSE